jgi:transposase
LSPDDGAEHGDTIFYRLSDAGCGRVEGRQNGASCSEAVRGIGRLDGTDRSAAAGWAGKVPGRIGGHRRPVLADGAGDWHLARLVAKPDLTMCALTAELAARGVTVAPDMVWRFARRAGQALRKDADGRRADAPEGGAAPGALAGATGDIVIADSLGSHSGLPARRRIRNAGAHLPVFPPHSPHLNHIKMVFAKLKALFRKTDERTIETLWRTVEPLRSAVTSDECLNNLRHAGHASL